MRLIKVFICIAAVSILSGCVSSGGTRIDNIPMYGQPEVVRPDFLKKADEDFINKAAAGLGSREEASKAWYAQGERFMSEGNLDYAMRRYNQSWLLNPNNYQPYWGFGRILLQQGKGDDAIGFLEKAEVLIDDQYQKVALLTDLGSAYSYKAKEQVSFYAKANDKFAESIALDPSYPNSWRRWAYSLYEQGSYKEAWDKVKKAQSLNARPFPPAFLASLRAKAPEPE